MKPKTIPLAVIVIRYIQLFAWCGLIFFLSSQSQLPGPEDKLADFLLKKIAHITVYAIMFLFAYRAFVHTDKKRRFFWSFVFCLTYAISDEIHQSFIPGRTATIRDVGFDFIGMVLMYGKLKGFRYLMSKRSTL